MAEIVYMPKLSDTMTEGVVAAWNKNVGDEVKEGEILAEIETDKATMEFESFYDGVLLHIGVEIGKAAPVNSVLAVIGEKGEDIAQILKSAESPADEETKESSDAPIEKSEPIPETTKPIATESKTIENTATTKVSQSNDRVFASPLAKKISK
jgi:pyruvate dehydrogenase E2 component (dihydrolipoamide acetyltransferase)